jgi:hypothetical protein
MPMLGMESLREACLNFLIYNSVDKVQEITAYRANGNPESQHAVFSHRAMSDDCRIEQG